MSDCSVLHLVDRLADVLLIRASAESTKARMKRLRNEERPVSPIEDDYTARLVEMGRIGRENDAMRIAAEKSRVENIIKANPINEANAQAFYQKHSAWLIAVGSAIEAKKPIPKYQHKPPWLLQYELSKEDKLAEEYYAKEHQWMLACLSARRNGGQDPPPPIKSEDILQMEEDQNRIENENENAHLRSVPSANVFHPPSR